MILSARDGGAILHVHTPVAHNDCLSLAVGSSECCQFRVHYNADNGEAAL